MKKCTNCLYGMSASLISVLFTCFVFLFSLPSVAQSPGGVSSGLMLWLKSDAGTSTTTDNANVSTWTDNVNGLVLTTTNPPLYIANSSNYNPAIFYDRVSYHVLPSPIPILNSTIFMAGILEAGSSGDGYHEVWTTDNETDFPLRIKSGQLGHTGNGEQFVVYNWNRNEVSFAREHIFSNKDVVISKQGSHATLFPALAVGTGGYYYLGRDANRAEGFGNVSETFIYNSSSLAAADIQKIESYLAFKYGLTLDNTGAGVGRYLLSDATIAWDASSFHRDVIGLIRDNSSGLLQKQSHTTDDSLRLFVASLAGSNQLNTGVVTNNLSAIMIGSNGATLQGDFTATRPAGIFNRLGRTWKVSNTNFTDNFSVEIKWDNTGNTLPGNLRLLVSDSPDFSAASVYDNGSVIFSNGSIIASGIGNAMIPAGSTKYFTIGSANASAALPVKLVQFTATVAANSSVNINWQTAAENNNDYFTVERSADAGKWEAVAKVKSAGNSSSLQYYSVADNNPYSGLSYYRLKQTDTDGKNAYSNILTVKIDKPGYNILLYPNPVSAQLTIKADAVLLKTLKIYSSAGQDVSALVKIIQSNNTDRVLNVSGLAPGIYTVKTANGIAKLIKQ